MIPEDERVAIRKVPLHHDTLSPPHLEVSQRLTKSGRVAWYGRIGWVLTWDTCLQSAWYPTHLGWAELGRGLDVCKYIPGLLAVSQPDFS